MTKTTCYRPNCDLHGLPCCEVCCHHSGECDYGMCHRQAVVLVDCMDAAGRVYERRPACRKHANWTPLGVGSDVRTEREEVAA